MHICPHCIAAAIAGTAVALPFVKPAFKKGCQQIKDITHAIASTPMGIRRRGSNTRKGRRPPERPVVQ